MTSMQMFEANLGTRNEAEAAALVLEAAKNHLLDTPMLPEPADLVASVILMNLSLLTFPEQEPKMRRGGL